MKIVIKIYPGQKWWSQIYLCGDIACEMGGMISHTLFEKMKSQNILIEIPATEIIEKYSKPSFLTLFSDIKECRYYDIKKVD